MKFKKKIVVDHDTGRTGRRELLPHYLFDDNMFLRSHRKEKYGEENQKLCAFTQYQCFHATVTMEGSLWRELPMHVRTPPNESWRPTDLSILCGG